MLPDDYRDMIVELLRTKTEFVIVGAFAMSVFGYTRSTGDIDIFVNSTEGNINRLWEALLAFGAPLTNISKKDFMERGTIFQIGIAPLRIDILTKIDGVSFNEISPENHTITKLEVPIIDLKSLIKNKSSTGRLKDLADCEELRKL